MKTLNCIIIEDQLPAQRVLTTYVKDLHHLNLVGCFTNAISASEALLDLDVQLIFLDINLPKISGINFLKNLSNPPHIIITSAYSHYALEGFELDVVDYLLKPFSFERFLKAVLKVQSNEKLTRSNEEQFVFIKSDKEFHKVELNHLLYVKSDDNYVKFVCSHKTHMQIGSLQQWEEQLPEEFIRIHKSYLVNLTKIEKLSGNRVFVEGQEIPVGRAYRESLVKRISS